jgi:hypothetical protein
VEPHRRTVLPRKGRHIRVTCSLEEFSAKGAIGVITRYAKHCRAVQTRLRCARLSKPHAPSESRVTVGQLKLGKGMSYATQLLKLIGRERKGAARNRQPEAGNE